MSTDMQIDNSVVESSHSPSVPKKAGTRKVSRSILNKEGKKNLLNEIATELITSITNQAVMAVLVKQNLASFCSRMDPLLQSAPNTRTKKPRDPACPRKPVGAFFIFQNEQRDYLQTQYNVSGKALTKKSGEIWGTLTDVQKLPYENQAKINLQQYAKDMELYNTKKEAEVLQASNATEDLVSSSPPPLVDIPVVVDAPAVRKTSKSKSTPIELIVPNVSSLVSVPQSSEPVVASTKTKSTRSKKSTKSSSGLDHGLESGATEIAAAA